MSLLPINSAYLQRKFRDFTESPMAMDTICGHVANGGSIITLCEVLEFYPHELFNWIHSDPERDKRYQKALKDSSEWAVTKVLQEIKAVALSDIRALFHTNGALKAVHEWPAEVAKCVSAIEVQEETNQHGEVVGYTKRVKFWDKPKALEMLGRHLKLFVDRLEVEGKVTLEQLLDGSWDRSQKLGDGKETQTP